MPEPITQLCPQIYFLLISQRSAFFKFNDLFPECALYREAAPRVEPLICLLQNGACHVGHNCMDTLAKRVSMIFNEVLPSIDLMVLYYRKRNLPGMGAGIFWRDFREPRVITVNPRSWERLKQRGQTFEFSPDSSFFLTGRSATPQLTAATPSL
jgi:hypothetical protein